MCVYLIASVHGSIFWTAQYHTANQNDFYRWTVHFKLNVHHCPLSIVCLELLAQLKSGRRQKTAVNDLFDFHYIESDQGRSDFSTNILLILTPVRNNSNANNGMLLILTTIKLIDYSEQLNECGWMNACAHLSINIIPMLTKRDSGYELDDYNKCK